MKTSYIIGASAILLTGVMAAWGVSEYFVLKGELNDVRKGAQPTSPTPSLTPSPSSQAGTPASPFPSTPSPSPAPSVEPNFDTLPLCDQLDRIAKSGKVISEFIVNSGRYAEFAAQVNTKCNWHSEQLKQADRILHPPPPIVNGPLEESSTPEPKRTPWNNCNGLQEPGESASKDCKRGGLDDHYYDYKEPNGDSSKSDLQDEENDTDNGSSVSGQEDHYNSKFRK